MTVSRRLIARVALAVAVILAVVAAVVAIWPRPAALSCNGSPSLCDRAYNQVTYLTDHNAMSSGARGFVAAEQDPDLQGQLDDGVRALMLDLHHWTTPADAAPILATLTPQLRSVVAPLVRGSPSRPGIWLCHEICQLGADPATAQLAVVRQWLSSHPHSVVTLILEDDVSFAEVRSTVSAAGLDPWLATPPPTGGSWPTLGQLVKDHHTLMVFTQNAKPTTGPIQNLYQYSAETPFAAPSASALSCDPGRGSVSAPLFLINNWVTMTIPTKAAALSVDRPAVLAERVRRCEAQRGMRTTFLAVDFSEVGNPLQVVDALNGR